MCVIGFHYLNRSAERRAADTTECTTLSGSDDETMEEKAEVCLAQCEQWTSGAGICEVSLSLFTLSTQIR